MNKLSTFLLLALGLGSCQRSDMGPTVTVARGQILRYDLTYDEQGEHPRLRCIVQLAPPLRLKGLNSQDYVQVKVFTLSDTAVYRPGAKVAFIYREVPQDRQTHWKTNYEWSSSLAYAPGYTPNPEIRMTRVQLQ